MGLRYNPETGEFENEDDGGDTIRVSPNMRYNNATGEFEPIRGPAPRRRRRPAPPDAPRWTPPRTSPSSIRAEAAIRRAEAEARLAADAVRRREARRRTVFAGLLGLMLFVDVLVLLFGGGGNVLLMVCAVFFFLWFCYRLVTGALWPWLVLAGIALASWLK